MAKTAPTVTPWQAVTQQKQASQWVAGLDQQLKQLTDVQDMPWQLDRGRLQTGLTPNSFWIIYTFPTAGKLAIRTCFDPQTIHAVKIHKRTKSTVEYQIEGSLGLFSVRIERPPQELMLLRYTTSLEPQQDFTVQAMPRDLYVLDDNDDLADTEGMVYVTQSGPTAGLAYLSVTKPVAGTVFYFQNLTLLSDYCQMTHTDPSGSVTVQWPEMGFALPTAEQPLAAGKKVVVSDAFICLSDVIPNNEFEAADHFLEAIARVYKQLPKPDAVYYDWPKAAKRTVQALTESPDCGRRIKNHFYLNAYVGGAQKPPESMVQLAILVPLWDYQQWLAETVPLVDLLHKNIPTFFEEKKATLMRWLPGEVFGKDEQSEEEDPAKIDSWYLLHTLSDLGQLADKGCAEAKDLLFRSLEFVIGAAHHFGYNWPVFYDSRTLTVIKAETSKGQGGELDVAGLFTQVMLQAYQFTKDPRYLAEAKQSAERLRDKGFELLYQSNITIMSALTLARLWKLTGNRLYFDLSRLSVANIIARLWIWDCNFGFGQQRSTFMGVAPLKDAEYLAAYEEGEVVSTMVAYLKETGTDVPPAIRVFFSEYMKYLLHRGRYYFPTELSPDMLSQQPREGRIIPDLPIPLEDLSTGWKQAGAVGQEVYGSALACILSTNAYNQLNDVPIFMYCNYPVYQSEYQLTGKDRGYAVLRLAGTADYTCRLRLLARGRQLPQLRVVDEDDQAGQPLKPVEADKTYQEYEVQGHLRIRIEWSKKDK